MIIYISSYLRVFAVNYLLRNVSINIRYKYTIKCLSNISQLTFKEIPNTVIGCNGSIFLNCSCLINHVPSNIANIYLLDVFKAKIKDSLLKDTQIKDIIILENAKFLCEELSAKLNYKYQLIAIDLELELNSDKDEESYAINQLVNSEDKNVSKLFEQIILKSILNWKILFPIIFNKSKYQKIASMQNSLSSIDKTIKKFADMSSNLNRQLNQFSGNESLLDKLNAIVMNNNKNGSVLEYDILNLSTENINRSEQLDAIARHKEEKDLLFSSSNDSDFFSDD